MAALIHMTDLLLALGMLGALLCPLPHTLAVYRHGLRTGGLAALAAAAALFAFGVPIEAAYHLLLFAIPGMAAGAALAGRGSLKWALVLGSAATAGGIAASYLILERLTGIPDALDQTRSLALAWLELVSWLPRAGGHPPAWFDVVPGLASPPLRAAWYDALVRLPFGIFLALGTMVFTACWVAGGILLLKLRETPRLPRLTTAPRLPWSLFLVLVATSVTPLPQDPWLGCLQANLWFSAAAAAYAIGYLHLLRFSHGHPLRGLLSLLASLALYYVAIWVGVLTTLNPPGDPALWAPTGEGPRPGQEGSRR